MTELNMAYNLNDNDNEDYEFANNQVMQMPQQPQPQQQVRKPQPPPIQQMPQQQPVQEQSNQPLKQHFTNYDYQYQYQQPLQQKAQQRYPEYSFWDRMVMSKREVLKLFILSLVIILGISIEKIGYHYLSNYINSVDLSSLQEFLVRLSFPILAFIILWIIKSL